MKLWLARAISFGIAWVIVLLALGVAGELLEVDSVAWIGMVWTCVGILARVARAPTAVADALPVQVDVGVALRFLLTSAVWPLLFVRRRK